MTLSPRPTAAPRRTGLRHESLRATPASRRHAADLVVLRRVAAEVGVTVLDELDEGPSATRVELARGPVRYAAVVKRRAGRSPRLTRDLAAGSIPWSDLLLDSGPYTPNRTIRAARDARSELTPVVAALEKLNTGASTSIHLVATVLVVLGAASDPELPDLSASDQATGVTFLYDLLDGVPVEWALRHALTDGASAS